MCPQPLSESTILRIGSGFRLQWEPRQGAYVLLYPEGMVQLNETAGEILKNCDGKKRVGEVIAGLEKDYEGPHCADEIREFLKEAYERGWLVVQ